MSLYHDQLIIHLLTPLLRATAVLCASMPIYKPLWNSISTVAGQGWTRLVDKISSRSGRSNIQPDTSSHRLEDFDPDQARMRGMGLTWNISTVSGEAGSSLQGHLSYP